jgi:hypothetical protein
MDDDALELTWAEGVEETWTEALEDETWTLDET